MQMIPARLSLVLISTFALTAWASRLIAQTKDYSDLCRRYPDIVGRVGDGLTLEEYNITAQDKLRSMGVDLYDLLHWILINSDYYIRTCRPPQPFCPGIHMIPGNLYRYGDKRALPYAQQYFKTQCERKDGEYNRSAAKYLIALGWDDQESVRIFAEGIHKLGGDGANLIGSALSGFPANKEMPLELRRAIFRSLSESRSYRFQTDNMLHYWSIMVAYPPHENEMLQMIDMFRMKVEALDDKMDYRLAVTLFVNHALDKYPINQPMPLSMLGALESLVKSEQMEDEQNAAEWRVEKERLIKALTERRRRDQGLRAPEGVTPVSSPASAHASAVPNAHRKESDPAASPAIKGSSEPNAPPPSSRSWVRVGVAGAVAAVLLVVIAALVLRRRARPR